MHEYSSVSSSASDITIASTPVITYVEDSSDNEVEEMAPKSSQSLRELMRGRNKVSTPPKVNNCKPQ